MNALTARLLVAVTVSAVTLSGAAPASADTDAVGATNPGPVSSVVHGVTQTVGQLTGSESLRSGELQQVIDGQQKLLDTISNVLKRTGSICIRCLK
ncbi:MAG: hypothetical protein QOF67_2661 [Mycobacterium sp.]|nr:hypothetical protein [Mycobacterium sp.]